MATTVSFELGNQRFVRVCEWKGEKRVDLREWNEDRPTKKGISLSLMRWKLLTDNIEYVNDALKNNTNYSLHVGGNVYCTVKEGNPCVDIRQYWKPKDEVVPCKKGLCLRPEEYLKLKEAMFEIGAAIPELDSVVPCQFQSDHANQYGYLMCPECNPNDFQNWNQECVKKEIVNNDDLLDYSRELGSNWQLFGIQLGYRLSQLKDLQETYPRQIETLLYVMLYEWQEVVKRTDNPKKLLAAAFSRAQDNHTARRILGNGVSLTDAKTVQPNATALHAIHRITF